MGEFAIQGPAARPEQYRLLIAMGVSTGIVSLLLVSLGYVLAGLSTRHSARTTATQSLSVHIETELPKPAPQPDFIAPTPVRVPPAPPQNVPVPAQAELETQTTPEEVVEAPPAIEWRTLIKETVTSMADEKRAQEESRSAMWNQTHSVMFAPGDEFVPLEQGPVLEDFTFKPEIHVLGLGVTIGACFIGIPIVGVPVEERTVGFRPIICASGKN